MKKGGQVTIFIILAILIVAIALVIFLIIKAPENTSKLNSDLVYNFVDECIREIGDNAVSQIGQNGGYYFPPSTSTNSGIPYYYLNKKNIMPSKEGIESQISLFIRANLFYCTKNFVDFKSYNISQGDISVKTTILNDKVVLKVTYPITISRGNEVLVIKDFQEEIPLRLGLIYDSVSEVLNSSQQGICMSCLYDIAQKNDFYVEMLDYNKNTIIIIFRDKNSRINEEDYEYVYAVEI